jgi:hypothetical protein
LERLKTSTPRSTRWPPGLAEVDFDTGAMAEAAADASWAEYEDDDGDL